LADSRIENIEAMRRSKMAAGMSMIRSPMFSQVKRVVASADMSFNSELETVRRLSLEARQLDRTHAVVLMVELGDLREGIMPVDLMAAVTETLGLPNIVLKGLGTNLACRSGVSPDDLNMGELSRLANMIEAKYDISLDIVSGGNSANLDWVFSTEHTGRINNLRLGESILLGCETLQRNKIDGLHSDAFTLVAEVIESKVKPTMPRGSLAQTAFGALSVGNDRGTILQSIAAIGIQDVDLGGITAPKGIKILGGSSDHLIISSSNTDVAVGTEIAFQLDYSALLRAMTSPFVTKLLKSARKAPSLRQTA
jgi:predicted amino acid racemase